MAAVTICSDSGDQENKVHLMTWNFLPLHSPRSHNRGHGISHGSGPEPLGRIWIQSGGHQSNWDWRSKHSISNDPHKWSR